MSIPLPTVAKPVVIDGYTQGVASPNTLAVGNDAVLLIEINGTGAGTPIGALLSIGGGNSTVKGLVINRAQGGNSMALRLINNGGSTVSGNFIGVDPTGNLPRFNMCQGLNEASRASGLFLGDPLCNASNPLQSCPAADMVTVNGSVSINEVSRAKCLFLSGTCSTTCSN